MEAPLQPLMNRQEVARLLHCSISTVKRAEENGGLVPLRLGKRLVRYRVSDVQAYQQGAASLNSPAANKTR